MLKFVRMLVFLLLLQPSFAAAYEFKLIDRLFDTLISDYSESVDIKKLSLLSGQALSKFDTDVKLYYSDSKAFLYTKQQLIKTFELPKNRNISSWKQILSSVLSTGIDHSIKLSNKTDALENEVLKIITANLDKYSRLEKSQPQKSFDYTLKDNILYIRASAFQQGIADKLKETILSHANITGLIIDLRGNIGGHFNEAIKTADLFLDSGLITYSQEKNHPTRYYQASAGDILSGKPIAVLIDEHTASAAEIVAAALSEQSRATLIGAKTFGKGTIQHMYNFDNQTLYLTSGYFFSPSGQVINNRGITPQICTGIRRTCQLSDKHNPEKDILIAINLIKKHFS